MKDQHEKIAGIYAIACAPTGRRYIGSSVCVAARWKAHRTALNRGNHRNAYLQRAWQKYGASAFDFQIIDMRAAWVLRKLKMGQANV